MAEYLAFWLPSWLAYTLAALVHVTLVLVVVLTAAAAFTWAERKVAGRLQDRLGPTRVGGRFGWLQAVADGLKLIAKEDIVPKEADSFLFRAAPYISFCASFTVFLALPFANGWVGQNLDIAVFFILAVAGLEVLGVILGGYASGSKWSLFGAMREAAQLVSYEIPLALCAAVPVMVAGTMNLVAIGNQQAGWAWNWLVFHDPFTFVTLFVYITCAVASVNRAPFDLAEAESELVAGFLTEYSGFRWSVFFMAEYASMFAVSILASILFLGGWNGPLPITHWLGMVADPAAGYVPHPLWAYLGNFLGMCNILTKGTLGVVFMMWLRWTLPRLRIDQVMTVCLKYCIPLAAAMFLGAMLYTYTFPEGLFWRRAPMGTESFRESSCVILGRSSVGNALRGVPGDAKEASVAGSGTPRRAFPTDGGPPCRNRSDSCPSGVHAFLPPHGSTGASSLVRRDVAILGDPSSKSVYGRGWSREEAPVLAWHGRLECDPQDRPDGLPLVDRGDR